VDLVPYLDVSIEQIAANVRQMNPHVTIIAVSAKTGKGLEEWFEWVKLTVATPGELRVQAPTAETTHA
jgi:hydrogenase nickel incorporation protein HypB